MKFHNHLLFTFLVLILWEF